MSREALGGTGSSRRLLERDGLEGGVWEEVGWVDLDKLTTWCLAPSHIPLFGPAISTTIPSHI
jgi:hypothetical protein